MTSTNAATMSTVPQYLACVADKLNPAYTGGQVGLQHRLKRLGRARTWVPHQTHLLQEIAVVSSPCKHAVCALRDLCIISHSVLKARFLRWLPRAFTNTLAIERELEKKTMDTVELRLIFLFSSFGLSYQGNIPSNDRQTYPSFWPKLLNIYTFFR